jgi:hypothetical protein
MRQGRERLILDLFGLRQGVLNFGGRKAVVTRSDKEGPGMLPTDCEKEQATHYTVNNRLGYVVQE